MNYKFSIKIRLFHLFISSSCRCFTFVNKIMAPGNDIFITAENVFVMFFKYSVAFFFNNFIEFP